MLREAVAALARGKGRDRVLIALTVIFGIFLGSGGLEIASLIIVLMAAALFEDRRVSWALQTKSFRRNRFRVTPARDTWTGEWYYRRLGHHQYSEDLKAHPVLDGETKREDSAEMIVYRGYNPFVGAGTRFEPWSMAFPLKPVESEDEPAPMPRFTLAELYDHVTGELLKTGRSPSLSPGQRLKTLTPLDRVVVSAHELVDHFGDDAARIVLPEQDSKPQRWAEQSVVDDLVARPLEWLRHFRCFEVEVWDRDIVLSAYLTFGLDEDMLYVEWTPCVLAPIDARFRAIDDKSPGSWMPAWEAAGDLLMFPLTFLRRLVNACTRIRPRHKQGEAPVGDSYGAAHSLRELAARAGVDNYFQLTDVERYVKVLESRLLRALGEFLEARSISVTEFMEQALQVTQNNVHIEGSVIGSNINTKGKARAGNVKIKGIDKIRSIKPWRTKAST